MPTTIQPMTCQLCNHTWLPRVADPASCPRCKRYDWRKPRTEESDDE